ncbi:hypothetical protein ACJ2A9_17650 [Anaerobacillus sp. MEB173]|uniref:hypothetical protein n=1 Tax=Anaerobacillus sp. MEB173 TaxID=3383345 RepID=UPI003F93DBFD
MKWGLCSRTYGTLFVTESMVLGVKRTYGTLLCNSGYFFVVKSENSGSYVRERLHRGHFFENSGSDVRFMMTTK